MDKEQLDQMVERQRARLEERERLAQLCRHELAHDQADTREAIAQEKFEVRALPITEAERVVVGHERDLLAAMARMYAIPAELLADRPDRALRIARAEATAAYEAGLVEHAMPGRIRALPMCPRRGIPVPWFVSWTDRTVAPDFRVADLGKMRLAHDKQLCWVCGQDLAGRRAFVIGPMCAINRVAGEPPSHEECAMYSARACPFLVRPHMRRRDDLQERVAAGEIEAPAGDHQGRNPGVSVVWLTHSYTVKLDAQQRPLFTVGHPLEVRWMTEARAATREEAAIALLAGVQEVTFPAAVKQGAKAVQRLQEQMDAAWRLLPKGSGRKAAPRLIVDPAAYQQVHGSGSLNGAVVGFLPPLGGHTDGQQQAPGRSEGQQAVTNPPGGANTGGGGGPESSDH